MVTPLTISQHRQVIQLYEMIVVRHGLMLVGPTGGGKSSNLHVLEETLTQLKQMGQEVRTKSGKDPTLFFVCGRYFKKFLHRTHECKGYTKS